MISRYIFKIQRRRTAVIEKILGTTGITSKSIWDNSNKPFPSLYNIKKDSKKNKFYMYPI